MCSTSEMVMELLPAITAEWPYFYYEGKDGMVRSEPCFDIDVHIQWLKFGRQPPLPDFDNDDEVAASIIPAEVLAAIKKSVEKSAVKNPIPPKALKLFQVVKQALPFQSFAFHSTQYNDFINK